MKSLFLIRHAKSSWADSTSDRYRKIAARGIADAHRMGTHIANRIPNNAIVYCSTAVRAKETAAIITSYLPSNQQQIIDQEELYTFDAVALANFISTIPNEISALLVFGHNEAITNFVNKFGSVPVDHVPTAGFVQINFDTNSWDDLSKGTTAHIQFPSALPY